MSRWLLADPQTHPQPARHAPPIADLVLVRRRSPSRVNERKRKPNRAATHSSSAPVSGRPVSRCAACVALLAGCRVTSPRTSVLSVACRFDSVRHWRARSQRCSACLYSHRGFACLVLFVGLSLWHRSGFARSRRSRASISRLPPIGRAFQHHVSHPKPRMTATPNHALQRTAPCVTAPASATAFPPTMQVPRRTPPSLSLGSLGYAESRHGTER